MALILFHGWGVNKYIFSPLLSSLPGEVKAYDLPGHGERAAVYESRSTYLARLASTLRQPVDVLGWSMGGLYALDFAALYPHLVRSLLLVATFPRFKAAPDYPCGLKNSILATSFAARKHEFPRYLEQFLLLQCLHNNSARDILRQQVFPKLFSPYNLDNLGKTLDDTLKADLRAKLTLITQPVLLIFGAKDRVTPPAFAAYLQHRLAASKLILLSGSGHLPFFSESELFGRSVNDFLAGQS